MNTFTPSPTTITRKWHLIDANGKILGRVASEAAKLILGKHKPDYATHMDTGDTVVIINSEKIKTTGNKELQKSYFRHSQYPGGDRSITLEKLRQEKPQLILTHAVSGMLPDNKLKKSRMSRLHIVIGETHLYGQHFS